MLFQHKKKSANYRNYALMRVPYYPLIGIVMLWLLETDIWLKVFGSIVLLLLSIHFFRIRPYTYDSIVVTRKNLIIQQKMDRKTIPLETIESYDSSTALSIKMKDGNKVKINYGYWAMGSKKVNELTEAIKNSIKDID